MTQNSTLDIKEDIILFFLIAASWYFYQLFLSVKYVYRKFVQVNFHQNVSNMRKRIDLVLCTNLNDY